MRVVSEAPARLATNSAIRSPLQVWRFGEWFGCGHARALREVITRRISLPKRVITTTGRHAIVRFPILYSARTTGEANTRHGHGEDMRFYTPAVGFGNRKKIIAPARAKYLGGGR